ncbi:hypothetical protein D9Q81_08115 [Candidatus Korarchaeum cryptofilum]|uniref:Uncharacterized protein n=1 Tax=Candidatus Korarchaeum cryptofilum TaxID=498846 RepID=A0A429G1S3_9CREN|nr:hypothetical protein D9Q81_08115 [Candidatus Korarchaeum cryptofilum]
MNPPQAEIIKMGAQKTQSFSSGIDGQSLNINPLKSMARMFRAREGGETPLAHALTRGMGWGSCEPPEPADEGTGVKPALNAGSSRLHSWSSSPFKSLISLIDSPNLRLTRTSAIELDHTSYKISSTLKYKLGGRFLFSKNDNN